MLVIDVFYKWILTPEIVSKILSISFNHQTWEASAFRKHIVSFENCKWLTEKPSLPIVCPSIIPLTLARAINLLRPSATNVNRRGDKGSHCLKPLDEPKKHFEVPFNNMEKWGWSWQPEIHLIHLFPKPFCSNTHFKKSQSTLSYAFLKSNLHTIPENLDFFHLSTYLPIIRVLSRICLALTKSL